MAQRRDVCWVLSIFLGGCVAGGGGEGGQKGKGGGGWRGGGGNTRRSLFGVFDLGHSLEEHGSPWTMRPPLVSDVLGKADNSLEDTLL